MADTVIGAKLTLDASAATDTVKSFKQQLKEAQNEVQQMAAKFGETSKEAEAAARKAAELADKIGDAKRLTDTFNPDAKFKAISNSMPAVLGGFTAMTGAMALLGAESEDVQKSLLKVQAAMAISQGLNQLGEGIDAFKTLGSVIKTNVVGAFSTLKGAILSTGIGALVVAVGGLIAYFKNLGDAAEEAAEKQKQALETAVRYADAGLQGELNSIQRQQELDLAKAKMANKSEKELFDIQQMWERIKLNSYNRYRNEVINDDVKRSEADKLIKDQTAKIELNDLNFRLNQRTQAEQKAKENQAKALADFNKKQSGLQQYVEQIEEEKTLKSLERGKNIRLEQIEQVKVASNSWTLQNLQNKQNEEMAAQRLLLIEEYVANGRKLLAESVGGALGSLADLVGRQTATGKVLAIAEATINTYLAGTAILKNTARNPVTGALPGFAIAQMIATIAAGLVQVRNILKVPVPAGGGGGSVPAGSTVNAPTAQLPQATQTILNQGQLNQIGNAASRAYVVESDVTNNQERIRRLNRAARL